MTLDRVNRHAIMQCYLIFTYKYTHPVSQRILYIFNFQGFRKEKHTNFDFNILVFEFVACFFPIQIDIGHFTDIKIDSLGLKFHPECHKYTG